MKFMKMEAKIIICWSLIYICLPGSETDAVKSNGDEKTDALVHLENLVDSKYYFLNRKIDRETRERENSMVQLNKTLEFLFNQPSGKMKDGSQVHDEKEGMFNLDGMKANLEQNNKIIQDLSESFLQTKTGMAIEKLQRKDLNEKFVRIKRSLMEEKEERKKDLETVVAHLNKIGNQQNEIIKNQNVTNTKVCSWNEDAVSQIILTPNHSDDQQNEIVNEIKKLQKVVETMAGKFGAFENKLEMIGEKLGELNDKIQNVQDTIGQF